ncbi:Uncharacterised protein [BD1-7 clade bacterium]|uniref:BIG2 domain-containing protein n=1 Tax=BD1-7 clade bacterium TaxID=2029982 RepID=A0A5S9NKX5_9GAMM|nr:Uncharacterised protein [BD1-7 clade bacterium]CAA0093950.1 Uncharacterised protein [BD1-7 clade bacterium]
MRALFLSLFASLFLYACSDDDSSSYIVDDGSTLAIVNSSEQLNINTTTQLEAVLTEKDGRQSDISSQVNWSTSNASIATVNQSGLVTAIAEGPVTISVSYRGLKASTSISVTDLATISLSTNAPRPTLLEGLFRQVESTAVFEDGSTELVTKDAQWTSDNESIATVTNGRIFGVNSGRTIIRAVFDGTEAQVRVEIAGPNQMVDASLSISPNVLNLPINGDTELTAFLVLSSGEVVNVTNSVTWVSSNTSSITVGDEATNKGRARAVGTGFSDIFAVIQAGTQTFSAETKINAIETDLIDVEIVPANPIIHPNALIDLSAIAYYADGTSLNITRFSNWTSASADVATVAANGRNAGRVAGLTEGETTIRAVYEGMTGDTALTVDDITAESLQINPSDITIPDGLNFQYRLTAQFSDGSFRDVTEQATWLSVNPSIANIGVGNFNPGLLTAVEPGTTEIQARFSNLTINSPVTVTDAAVSRLTVQPNTASVARGTQAQLTATAYFTDNSQMDVTNQAGWTSSDPDIVKVETAGDQTGLVTGLELGSVEITVAYGNQFDRADVTVTDATIVSMQLSPVDPSLPLGVVEQFRAVGGFSDGTARDVTAVAEWQSSANAIVQIVHDGIGAGRAEAKAEGQATISVAYMGLNEETSATVIAPVVDRIIIEPLELSIANGLSTRFTATAYYTDGTSRSITDSATWSSSDSDVMSIESGGNNPGRAQARSVGTTVISATFAGITQSSNATVTDAFVTSLALTPKNISMPSGTRRTFRAMASFSDNTSRDVTRQADWSSSNSDALTVVQEGPFAGNANAHNAGTAELTVNFGGHTDATTITVINAVIERIDIGPLAPTAPRGETVQLFVVALYTNGMLADITNQALWSSSDNNIMQVESLGPRAGTAYARNVGAAQITASYGGFTNTVTATVTDAILTQLVIEPADALVGIGLTKQYKATAIYSDNRSVNVTKRVGWQVASNSRATITSTGLLNGLSAGNTRVLATYKDQSASVDVRLVSGTLIDLSIEPDTSTLPIKGVRVLKAFGLYQAGTETFSVDVSEQVSWRSANATIATVENNPSPGRVTAESAGSVVITARLMGQTAAAGITVSEAVLQSITIDPQQASIPIGATQRFTATGHYDDGSAQNLSGLVAWRSTQDDVAAINPAGVATGLTQGTTSIRATYQGVNASTSLAVSSVALQSIRVTPRNLSLPVGETLNLFAIATYSDNTTKDITDKATWVALTPDQVHVSNSSNNKGKLTAIARGAGQIRIAWKDKVRTADFTVTPAVIEEISVEPFQQDIAAGLKLQMRAFARYSDGRSVDITQSSTWQSDDKSVAKVSSKGRLSAKSQGNAAITARYRGELATSAITVTAAVPVELSITPFNKTYIVGQSQQLRAIVRLSDNSRVDMTEDATWMSDNPTILAVQATGSNAGFANAYSAGIANVTARFNSLLASSPYQVNNVALTGVTLSPQTDSVPQGLKIQYTATATYADSSTMDVTDQADWDSLNSNVATIDQDGLATSSQPGQVTMQVRYKGFTDTGSLTVTNAVVNGLRIAPADNTLNPGAIRRYKAYAELSNGGEYEVTKDVFWKSSDKTVATISNVTFFQGLLIAKSTGDTVISATFNYQGSPFSAQTNLTVNSSGLISIAVTGNSSLGVGDNAQLTATATFLNAVTLDVTAFCSWSSNNAGIATVTNGIFNHGKVHGVAAGSADIKAVYLGISGELNVTVSN